MISNLQPKTYWLLASFFFTSCNQAPSGNITPASSPPSNATKTPTTSAVPPIVRSAQSAPNLAEATGEGQPTQPDVASNASAPSAPIAAPGAPPTNASPRIQLSTGIALAQTLPDGTSVLCSMEYQWVGGGALPGVEYLWVIELGNGQRMTGLANVSKRNGTIQAILRGVKPDQGPFKAAVFVKNQNPGLGSEQISDFVNLTN